jgi:ABC-type Zn2+ transport system substrate-binding protein/surface adhesin
MMHHSKTMEGCSSPLVVKFADTQVQECDHDHDHEHDHGHDHEHEHDDAPLTDHGRMQFTSSGQVC